MNSTVSDILIYPIKSAAGISLSTAWVEQSGLSFDRRFMVTDRTGKMVTGRTHPILAYIIVSLQPAGITLSHPTMSPLVLKYDQFTMNEVSTHVWSDKFMGYATHATANAWLSHLLRDQMQLLFTGEKTARFGQAAQVDMSFADGFPLLVISEASLADLNERSPNKHVMEQFRTNLVVSGGEAFEEDSWAKIRIGTVDFRVDRPCSRCVFTTLDLESGRFRTNGEPLTTLSQYRTDKEGNVNFGMNLVVINEGVIKAGDCIEVLEYRVPECYEDNGTYISGAFIDPSTSGGDEKRIDVLINIEGDIIRGENQRSILEQAEEAGVSLDYSCRAGVCGSCKMRLIDGDVDQPDMPALYPGEKDDGIVLACCCVPKGDITLAKL